MMVMFTGILSCAFMMLCTTVKILCWLHLLVFCPVHLDLMYHSYSYSWLLRHVIATMIGGKLFAKPWTHCSYRFFCATNVRDESKAGQVRCSTIKCEPVNLSILKLLVLFFGLEVSLHFEYNIIIC